MKHEPKHLAYWLCKMPNIEAARECIKELRINKSDTLYFRGVAFMFTWINTSKGQSYWHEIDLKTRI